MELEQRITREIGAGQLAIADVEVLSKRSTRIRVADEFRRRIEAARAMVVEALEAGSTIYGVTTGFGALSDRRIPTDDARELQANLLRSHASGTGAALPESVVRAMLGLRVHALAIGHSGVRNQLIDLLVAMYNKGITPVVPSQGSVGASGDLAPLAHLALPLIGEGRVQVNGQLLDAADGFKNAGLIPIQLEPKEALALINGTQTMTSIGTLAFIQAERVIDAAIGSAALTVIALDGRTGAFDDLIQRARPHAGQIQVAQRMRHLLQGWNRNPSVDGPVQDRYSIRAVPQVIGAILDTTRFVRQTLEIEINSATDNPLFFPDHGKILNGANFHGHPIALACDHLKTAVASLTTFGERRIASLVDTRSSGLPAFLAPSPGLHSGLMIPHYLAASLVSENRILAHPASVDSLSTSADVEDYNSMGTIASRNLQSVVENAARVTAVELICAAQAVDLRGDLPEKVPAMLVYHQVRDHVPFLSVDQFGLGTWVEELAARIRAGTIAIPETGSEAG